MITARFLLLTGEGGFDWSRVLHPSALVFLIGGAIAIVAIVATQVRNFAKAKQDAALKQSMIERGFSADEIVRVLEGGKRTGDD